MYQITEEHWPIVVVASQGAATGEALDRYFAAWDRWIARGEPMGLLMHMPNDDATKLPKDLTKRANDWQKMKRDQISKICAGMVVVMPSKLLLIYRPIMALATQKRMGCPGAAFATEPEALAWLNERLQKAH